MTLIAKINYYWSIICDTPAEVDRLKQCVACAIVRSMPYYIFTHILAEALYFRCHKFLVVFKCVFISNKSFC